MKLFGFLNKHTEIQDILKECIRKRDKEFADELYNVLFLDYDGVVNVTWRNYDGPPFDTGLVENVNTLCHMFDLKIVITSSWRSFDGYEESLIDSGLAKDISIIGKTDELGPRDKEIMEYLKSHPYIEKFIILDDIPMESLKDYQIQTRYPIGFDKEHLKKAIDLLNNQKPNRN